MVPSPFIFYILSLIDLLAVGVLSYVGCILLLEVKLGYPTLWIMHDNVGLTSQTKLAPKLPLLYKERIILN